LLSIKSNVNPLSRKEKRELFCRQSKQKHVENRFFTIGWKNRVPGPRHTAKSYFPMCQTLRLQTYNTFYHVFLSWPTAKFYFAVYLTKGARQKAGHTTNLGFGVKCMAKSRAHAKFRFSGNECKGIQRNYSLQTHKSNRFGKDFSQTLGI
jgi:hypothetical protein